MAASDSVRPLHPIRRFDVFAEVNRLEALAEGRAEDEAKGHGIWLAKVVAGRRGGRKAEALRSEPAGSSQPGVGRADRFKHAGDELQTDETFDREIIERMGESFYDQVFGPAIRAAVDRGEKYETFRDTIRTEWKPARAARS